MSTPSQKPSDSASADETDYPEQRHAGKVGYGPNFSTRATVLDRVVGLTQEARGKVMHKPDLVNAGHEKYTGEAKRRKALGLDQDESAFDNAEDDKSQPPASGTPKSDTPQTEKPPGHSMPGTQSTADPGSVAANAHTSDPGAKEQAATVAPQGSRAAEPQAKGEMVEHVKDIDERPR